MLSSLYSGISGLLSNSNTLNVVGNNIANVNTVGYKSCSTSFADVLYQSVSSSSGSSQVGRGSTLASVRTDFSQGSFETTSSATDLAIGGSGFFIVQKPGSEALYYTRAGSFSLDKDGYMVDAEGNYLQGKEIDATTGTAMGVDNDIIISQEPSSPKATENIEMTVNLQSDSNWTGTISSPTGASVQGVTVPDGSFPVGGHYTFTYADADSDGDYAVTLTLKDDAGTTIDTFTETEVKSGDSLTDFGGSGIDVAFGTLSATATSTVSLKASPNYSSSINVYDSLGTPHMITVNFYKTEVTSTSSTWDWEVTPSGSDEVVSGGTGQLSFNKNGVLLGGSELQEVVFNFDGAADGQSINLDLGSSTQYTISSKTNYQSQDGYAPGVLQSISVSDDGIISGTYDNGRVLKLYQITLATFNNANGLKKEGGNLYSATIESGVAYTTTPGDGGTGALSANSLEQSNVDLATEFVRMIVAQRGYEASSKVITTTDEVLQTLMNLKR